MPKGVELLNGNSNQKAKLKLFLLLPQVSHELCGEAVGVSVSSYKLKARLLPRHTIGLDLQPC